MSAAALAMDAARLFALAPARFGVLMVRARAGPTRDAYLAMLRGLIGVDRPWRRLPMGIDDAALLGGLDLTRTLADGAPVLALGLLAQADGGVLIAPSAERMGAGLAARIAAVLDQGGVQLEREGRSLWRASQFGVIGLDEGEDDESAPAALWERAAFIVSLDGLGHGAFSAAPAALQAPREASASDADIEALCRAASALGVAAIRAPLWALRAARLLAGGRGQAKVAAEDLTHAAGLVFGPRAAVPPEPVDASSPPEPPPDSNAHDAPTDQPIPPEALEDVIVEAARAAAPVALLAMLAQGKTATGAAGQGAAQRSLLRGRPVGAKPGLPRQGACLALLATLRAAAPWQKLRPAKPGRPIALARDDLRVRTYQERSETSVIFVVDASGSAAFARLAEVKGAIEAVLAQAYVSRTHVALVTFRHEGAEIIVPPTRSLARARARLAALPGGGGTPLAAGLEAGLILALGERAKGRSVVLLALSDGRANIARDGGRDRARAQADALAAARRVRAAGLKAVFVDTARWPSADNAAFAAEMGARYAPLPFADAAAMQALAAS
jgi:magnesium chelatase subunit D